MLDSNGLTGLVMEYSGYIVVRLGPPSLASYASLVMPVISTFLISWLPTLSYVKEVDKHQLRLMKKFEKYGSACRNLYSNLKSRGSNNHSLLFIRIHNQVAEIWPKESPKRIIVRLLAFNYRKYLRVVFWHSLSLIWPRRVKIMRVIQMIASRPVDPYCS